MHRRSIITIAALLSTSLTFAQSPSKLGDIAPKMQGYVDSGEVSGAVTLVGSKAAILHHDAVGKADLAAGRAMKKDALFRIMSMTKPITAIGIMILQDEGKLNINDPVEKYLPEFKGQMMIESLATYAVTLTKPPRPITLRDLLTHTSGLPSSYPPGLADVYTKRNRTLSDTILAQSQRPLEFEPGKKWSYCNAGIDTLGRIIEVVSNAQYDSFLFLKVFQPLGMTSTTFYPTAAQLESLAVTYGKADGKLAAPKELMVDYKVGAKHPVPAGGLFSTAGDLAKLYQMMLNKGEFNGKRIISEKAVAEMTAVQTGDLECGFVPGMSFGFGWAVVKEPKGVTANLAKGSYGHGGAYGTQAWVDPVNDRFYILMIQRTGLPNADASPMRRELQELGKP